MTSTVWARLRRALAQRTKARRPRIVRRTIVHCPQTGAAAEIDLLMKETGRPDRVLSCSERPESPPACDQACRNMAETVLGAPRAVIICPPGSEGPPEETG
jgi:hypothetical protein